MRGTIPTGPAREGVKREQKAEAHQRLSALHDIAHGRTLQGMHEPGEDGGEREEGEAWDDQTAQRVAQESEKDQTGEEVDQKIEGVIAPDIGAADRPIDRERQIYQR